MNITFYYNSSEKERINKSLSKSLSLDGYLKDECSVINPIILVEAENLSSFNYCYIKEFNRFYYILDTSVVRTGLWRVALSVDVLMSFKDRILNLDCIIDKQYLQNKSDLFINDGSFINESKEFVEIANFQSGFNDKGEFILITAGAI